MRRSEMVDLITQKLKPLKVPTSISEELLSLVEFAGMLPPATEKWVEFPAESDETGVLPIKKFEGLVNEWEPEEDSNNDNNDEDPDYCGAV
jgi:hypothetical protein